MSGRSAGILSAKKARKIDFDESAVFLQMPGDHVVTGTIRGNSHLIDMGNIPRWMPGMPDSERQERVLLYIPPFKNLNAHIGVLLHNKNDSSVQGYNLFIKTINDELFKSHLLPEPPHLSEVTTPYVYVKMPDYHSVYGGTLTSIDRENAPRWLFTLD